MSTIGIGVLGCGNMATELAKRCVGLGQRIVAVYDPSVAAQDAARKAFGAEIEPAAEALCARTDVDAVLVGSPNAAHCGCVLSAAAAKKPVYCEKPLAVSVAECDRMIEACRTAGVPLFVGQVLRLFPLFQRSRDLIAEGAIGTPRAVSITRAGYAPGFAGTWRERRAEAGGMLLEINAHELDYMRSILGKPVESYARLDNLQGGSDYEDQGFVMVSFESGGVGCLHTSLSSPVGEYRVHIQGTGGNMVHGGFGGSLAWKDTKGASGEVQAADIEQPDPYEIELASWIDSLTKGTPPLFTGKDGRAAVAMAEAAYLSAVENRPIPIAAS